MDSPILEAAGRRPIILDGAMGTELIARGFLPGDGGFERLVLTRPDVVRDVSRSYLDAGADAIQTHTFGANALSLRAFGLEAEVRSLNRAAVDLAREAADAFSTPERPRRVAGSIGPGPLLPSLGQCTPGELEAAVREQASALIAGGVDLIRIETCRDAAQAIAAIRAVAAAGAGAGRRVPVLCTLMPGPDGRLATGLPLVEAAARIVEEPGVDALGLNCMDGPEAMGPRLAELARVCPLPLAALPNAGLPVREADRFVYRLSPDAFAAGMCRFVRDLGVTFAGGCCGTTPAHIRALARALADRGVLNPPAVSGNAL